MTVSEKPTRAVRDHEQRLQDMSVLEVRREPGGPWELLHDVYPGILADVRPCLGGPPDERAFIMWAMQTGIVTFVPTIDPECPLAFRLSGQFRDRGGWQVSPAGVARMLGLAGLN